jgi:hypothetical protein
MNEKRPSSPRPIQLELFHSTRQLNLSEAYESIPKEVAPNDPAIVWESDNLALPIEKRFTVDGQTFVSEIKPVTLRDRKTKAYRSFFPYFRELRLEYALISLASKQWLSVDYERGGDPSYKLAVTYYQIQKEIVEAINTEEGKNLSPNECPYNTASIREGLNVLKQSVITVYDASGKKEYSFNRIKDIYMDGTRTVVEFGSMISSYISRGDWNVADAHSILASKTYYTMKLKTLLHLKFRYAKKGAFYNPSLSLLMEKIGFNEYSQMRDALRRMTELLESLPEVDHVDVIQKKEGKKIVDAVYHIFPSESFVTSMIESNTLNKRAKTALVDREGEQVLIEPLERDFPTRRAYEEAKRDYDVCKGKILYSRRHLPSK